MSKTQHFFSLPGLGNFAIPLPKLNLVQSVDSARASGTKTVYTVPAGKRAMIGSWSHYNTGGGNANVQVFVTIGGVDYNFTSYAVNAGAVSGQATPYTIFEAGEVLKFTVTGASVSLNTQWRVMEFDDSAPIKCVNFTAFTGGADTVYTCPVGKVAAFIRAGSNDWFYNNARLTIINMSGGARTYTPYIVPSGGSAAAGNQANAATTVADGTLGDVGVGFNAVLTAGDFVAIDSDSDAAGQLVKVVVTEIDANDL